MAVEGHAVVHAADGVRDPPVAGGIHESATLLTVIAGCIKHTIARRWHHKICTFMFIIYLSVDNFARDLHSATVRYYCLAAVQGGGPLLPPPFCHIFLPRQVPETSLLSKFAKHMYS
jgi:hypothetical protein